MADCHPVPHLARLAAGAVDVGQDGGENEARVAGNGNGNGQLTGLQQAFVDAWFGDAQFNATEAARVAGYSGGDDPDRERSVWASAGSRTLRNVKVQEAIAERWAAHGMSAEEVIARYAEQARASVADFLYPGSNGIDWDKVRERGHLIKKVTHRPGQVSQIEMYDAQHALDMIGKTMGLFTDRIRHEGEIDNRITLEFVNDWRQANQATIPASGPENGPD